MSVTDVSSMSFIYNDESAVTSYKETYFERGRAPSNIIERFLLDASYLGLITSLIKIGDDLRKLYSEGKVSFVEMNDLRMLAIFSALFLLERGVPISEIEISAYAKGETDDVDDWELYVEIKVPIDDAKIVLDLWDKLLKAIESQLGRIALIKYNLFLTGN